MIPFWCQLASKKLPKISQNQPKILHKSRLRRIWERLGGLLGCLGRFLTVLGSSWNVLEASWSVLRASWSVLEPFGPENSVQEAIFTRRGGAYPAQLGRQEPPIIKEKKDLVQQDYLQKDLRTLQTPVSEPRHAAGRLRARCGSTAQQSCEPATALRC